MPSSLVVREFRAFQKNTLRGFATLELPSGLVIHDVTVHVKDAKWWIGLPAVPQMENGAPRVVNGKPQYKPIIGFKDRETGDRFRDAALAAISEAHSLQE